MHKYCKLIARFWKVKNSSNKNYQQRRASTISERLGLPNAKLDSLVSNYKDTALSSHRPASPLHVLFYRALPGSNSPVFPFPHSLMLSTAMPLPFRLRHVVDIRKTGAPAAISGKWRPEAATASKDSDAAGRQELLQALTPGAGWKKQNQTQTKTTTQKTTPPR